MEIRGLTLDQIESAMEETTKKYNGNIIFKEFSARVPLDNPYEETITYTVREQWRVIEIREDGTENDSGFIPYYYSPNATPEEISQIEYLQCERRADKFQNMAIEGNFGPDAVNTLFAVQLIPEHEETYTIKHTYEYKDFIGRPLNKRGDGFRIRVGVKSSRRPGARVSSNPYMDKPKRIASACWHAHRDLFREFFKINTNTKIKTALAYYKGEDDFGDKYPATGRGTDGPLGYSIPGIGEACNCDEGGYPEYAVEGLTENQYQMRLYYWEDEGIKAPKPEKAIL